MVGSAFQGSLPVVRPLVQLHASYGHVKPPQAAVDDQNANGDGCQNGAGGVKAAVNSLHVQATVLVNLDVLVIGFLDVGSNDLVCRSTARVSRS